MKAPSTKVTGKRLVPSVLTAMCDQIWWLTKCFTTDHTFVRFLTCKITNEIICLATLFCFFLFTIKSECILTSQYHNLITTHSYIALNTNLFYLFGMSLHISSYFCNHCNDKRKRSPFTSNRTCELAELWQLSYFFYTQCVKELLIFILISTYTNLRSNTDPGLRVTWKKNLMPVTTSAKFNVNEWYITNLKVAMIAK